MANDVWTTLRMTHEGSKPVRKAKVEMLEGQLNRFIMYDDETPHEMFNWLKKLVNKQRALGSKKWTDCGNKFKNTQVEGFLDEEGIKWTDLHVFVTLGDLSPRQTRLSGSHQGCG
jgi:hypothetical protein